MEGQDEVSAREQHFHSQVRESTICFLLFAILYVVSYFIITRYKRKSGNPSPHFRDFGHASSSCVTHSWDSVGSFSTH
ncbi:LMBR1 isoform 10 [Pan troglodytes]|uniref:Limb development membrane protein 1 n=4 Tax=Hominidae TaxID=9604 RepID=F2Z2Z3_HUMAN|nr:limb development membrane protein 1 [Homo sapiens]KAI4016558.1 limb development membrane protein 1 [Homo sapiens]PNI36005.1 LMBR1 isoform 10 [Pan troglodytes]PNJ31238.1 LMBR1 isoform 9 [Pongo abelii]